MSDKGIMQNQTSPHEPDPGIAAYALGVLDSAERNELESHLAGCLVCRTELDRYEAVVGDLGTVARPVPPRPELRGELLEEIRAGSPVAAAPSLLHRHVPGIWLAVAATIAILSLVVLGALFVQLRETQDERDSARYTEHAMADYLKDGGTLSALLPPPGSPDTSEHGYGSLIVAPDQPGAMLVVYDLPPTNDDRTYRAWAERDGQRVDLGELHVNDEGTGWLYLSGPEPMSTYETIGMNLYSPDNPEGETFLVASVG
jgi:hypothetical protein